MEEICHLHWTSLVEKANGTAVRVGIYSSKVVIIRIKLDKDCKMILKCKVKSHQVGKKMENYKEETIEKLE